MNLPDNRPDNRPDHRPEHPSDAPLAQRARALYREASQRLDPATTGRLRAARRQALQAPPRHVARWLVPTGAFAVLALAALMMWQPPAHAPAAAPGASLQTAASDASTGPQADNVLPPDADKVDPSLYQNLDFYGWLAANDSQPADR